MPSRFGISRYSALLVFVLGAVLAACGDTETVTVTVTDTLYITDTVTVIVERPLYEELPEGAAGFVGYRSSTDAGAATCGECHASLRGSWLTTGHADAWAGLEGSGHAQVFCEGCHTVSELGNQYEGEAGWVATADTRYHDVQCESCHGPGQGHIDTPDAVAGPLAQVDVSADPLIGCGQCHNGTHHGFVDDWAQSPHSGVVASAASRESCASCHKGQGTLVAWGENADYIEKDGEPLAVTCAVCHDPHGSDNPANTRFSARVPDTDLNLCAKCHNRRTEPDAESSHGLEPHAPQAPLLLGTAGWFPPDLAFEPGQIVGTHGSENNEGLCGTCHLAMFDVTDDDGGFVQSVTGHLFLSIPCVDEQGIPTNADCGYTPAERNFVGCTEGCHGTSHGTPDVAANLLAVRSLSIADRAGTLLDLLWQVDPNLDGAGGPIDPGDGIFTTAEGALFNVNLAQFPSRAGSAEPGDNPAPEDVTGASTHNPFLVEALLIGSQQAVEAEYAVGAAGSVDYGPMIQEIIERARRHNGYIAQ